MDALADPETDLAAGLGPLASGYRAWLDEQETAIAGLPSALRSAGEAVVFAARQCADRIEAGIRLLTDLAEAGHEMALAAFRFANQAMALQRRHTTIGRLRESEGLSYADAAAKVEQEGTKAATWWPFQLAFILLNLPALADPAHPDRALPGDGGGGGPLVDLLFFPTGGGKTEAYLGLAAFTFAIRRLQGTVGGHDGEGVAVLMRYTLRLLTAQQFQRAASLVAACEVLRRERVK